MKPQTFKIWDTTTALSGKNGNTNLPFLSFRPKDGTVQFSSCAVNVMGLKDDSNIVFIESETHDVFFVCIREGGLPLRTNDKRNKWRMSAGLFVKYLAELCNQKGCFRVRLSRVAEVMPKGQNLPVSGFRLYVNEAKFANA